MQKNKISFLHNSSFYAINALMCLNGGLIASFSYSTIVMLATAITGIYIKAILNSLLGSFAISLVFLSCTLVFALGILTTFFIKRLLKNPKHQRLISLVLMIISYVLFIVLSPMFYKAEGSYKLYYILPVFYSSAIQYNIFGFMDGVQVSTMFATNNLRQIILRFSKYIAEKDAESAKTGLLFLFTFLLYSVGLVVGFLLYDVLQQNLFIISIVICGLSVLIDFCSKAKGA